MDKDYLSKVTAFAKANQIEDPAVALRAFEVWAGAVAAAKAPSGGTAQGVDCDGADFQCKAKDFGLAHDIKDPVKAMSAYASTAEGRTVYGNYRSKIGRLNGG